MDNTWRGVRALITGGAGLIGSTIADQLLEGGAAQVTVIDDMVRGRRENLAGAASTGRLKLVEGDIRDAGLVDDLTRGHDLVFHQAALRITHCAEEPGRAVQTMVNGTQNVLDAAVRHKVDKVLAASTASVYGEPERVPMTEDAPFLNRTLYGAAKIFDEQLLRAYADMYGLRYVAIRPFNVYGPRMDIYGVYTEVMIRWLQRLSRGESPVIFGDGLQTMDFIYVGDVARSYLCAAASDATDVVCNAGTGIETSLRDLCRMVCVAAGRPGVEPTFQPPRKVNPVSRRQASIDLARERIGFVAEVSLEDGLRRLVRWFDTLPAEASVA